jgi:glycerophosphoryl diester phosphodiesterase
MAVFDPRPAMIGHRGLGSGIVHGHEENTLGSFLGAIEVGLTWVEVDVRRTADDTLVVTHQPAYPDGVFLADLTGAEAGRRGTVLLSELLDALPPEIGVALDLKSCVEDAARSRLATTAAVLASVATREFGHRPLIVTSFDPAALGVLRELAAEVPLGLLTWIDFPIGLGVAAAAHLDVQLLAVHCGSLEPNRFEGEEQQRPLAYIVDHVHAAGREVLAWCPPPDQARELITAGADAICINDVPTAMLELSG